MTFLRFIETFKSRYPVLRTFLHRCVAQARVSGCVETMSGRWRSTSTSFLKLKTPYCTIRCHNIFSFNFGILFGPELPNGV